MVLTRLMMVLLISGSVSAPRGLMPCCCRAGEAKPAKAATLADAKPVRSCCAAHRSSTSSESSPHPQKKAPEKSDPCKGCAMPCCAPVLTADVPTSSVSFILDESSTLTLLPEGMPASLPPSGIFRPPRSLS